MRGKKPSLVRFCSLMIHHITLGNAIHFSLWCHFSIMEIKLREKWVAGFASVGKKKKYIIHSVH